MRRRLTPAELARVLALNVETGELHWITGRLVRRRAGSSASGGYRQVKIGGQNFLEHRVVWALHTGAWPVGKLDHENRCRSDNWPSNLRPATTSQNAQNTGAKGVSFRPGTTRRRPVWEARVKVDGRSHWLGRFPTEEAALAARRAGKARLHAFGKLDL